MPCPLCRQRKGRRACPAKGVEICAHCCGTKRLVEIDCPSGCVYLTGAHAPGWAGRETERRRDARRMAPHLQGLSEDQVRLFFLALVGIAGMRRAHREASDALLAQALSTVRKTAETRRRGILYDHQADDLRAQALTTELKGLFESKDDEGRPVALDDADLLPVLAALEDCVRATLRESSGPTEFLDMAARLVGARHAGALPHRPIILEP